MRRTRAELGVALASVCSLTLGCSAGSVGRPARVDSSPAATAQVEHSKQERAPPAPALTATSASPATSDAPASPNANDETPLSAVEARAIYKDLLIAVVTVWGTGEPYTTRVLLSLCSENPSCALDCAKYLDVASAESLDEAQRSRILQECGAPADYKSWLATRLAVAARRARPSLTTEERVELDEALSKLRIPKL